MVDGRDINLVFHPDEKKHLYRQPAVAMAASGTVTCELALAGIPHVAGYQVNFLTGLIGRFLINTEHVSLVNILAAQAGQDPVTPELLQGAMTVDNLTNEMTPLINDQSTRGDQLAGLQSVADQLQINDADIRPSTRAARSVLKRFNR
jgi:lipid-A-disaccharide synthase